MNGVTIQIYMVLIGYLILLLMEIPKMYGKKLIDKVRYIQLIIRQQSSLFVWMTRMTGDPKVQSITSECNTCGICYSE